MFNRSIALYPLSLNFLWVLPYYLMLITGVILPSDGNHGFLSLKSLGFLGTFFSMALHILSRRHLALLEFKPLLGFFLFATFLSVWILVGSLEIGTPWESQFDQFKVFLITGFVWVASIYFLYAGLISVQSLMKSVIYANFSYCFGKVFLALGHLLGLFNIFDVLQSLNFRFMSMGVLGDFSRLQTSVDIVTPFLFYFVLQSDYFAMQFPKGFKSLFFLVGWISIGLSFSRFLLAVGVVSYLLYLMTLEGAKLFKAFVIGITLSCMAISLIGWENMESLIQKRFFSSETAVSDLIRVEQIDSVIAEFEQHPFFGKGLGSFAKDNVRDRELRYSYEVQWAAFLMQFGIFGLLILCIPLAFILWRLLTPPFTLLRLSFALFFLLWLFSGFTNPFLISLSSGIIYTLFFLAGEEHLNA